MKTTASIVCAIVIGALAGAGMAAATAEEDAKTVRLFNGRDLTGWTPFIWNAREGKHDTTIPVGKVWEARDGILICRGRPTGYLSTERKFKNYKLALEWRWPEDTFTANSGVLVHLTTPYVLGQWPKSVEVQLFTRNAGDFWVIGTTLDVPNPQERKRGRRHVNLTNDSEKPVGQWNKMEITCRGNEILVHVNGELVNHATNCSVATGAIGLQAEGREIHFRNITLTPLRD